MIGDKILSIWNTLFKRWTYMLSIKLILYCENICKFDIKTCFLNDQIINLSIKRLKFNFTYLYSFYNLFLYHKRNWSDIYSALIFVSTIIMSLISIVWINVDYLFSYLLSIYETKYWEHQTVIVLNLIYMLSITFLSL